MRLEQEEELNKNAPLIDSFKQYCLSKGITLSEDAFGFSHTIGIVAHHPNILGLLCPEISKDKEGLFDFHALTKQYEKRFRMNGFLYADKFMIMAHPYFRRGMHGINNFAPRFIEFFWSQDFSGMDPHIAIDPDRVRINVDNIGYFEADTWFGAKFNKNIAEIEDGIVHLRPSPDIEEHILSLCFASAYSLDIKWESKNGIKSFQAEEFKAEDITIEKNGDEYHPVRYVHAEFDPALDAFRHFDGAVHFYTSEEYYRRRDSDFNYNAKNSNHIKTKSQKLFKINGKIPVDVWSNYIGHFMTGNPLVTEYFEGEYPDRILEILESIRLSRENRGK